MIKERREIEKLLFMREKKIDNLIVYLMTPFDDGKKYKTI